MVDAAWPTGTVPHEPEQTSYSEQIESNLASFKPDVGASSMWRRGTLPGTTIQCDILMVGTELAAFETFFRTTLGDGALPFTWTNPRYGVSKRYQFAPDQPPRWDSIGFDLYRVRLTMNKLT
jgi:hypothetical protein